MGFLKPMVQDVCDLELISKSYRVEPMDELK